MRVGHYEGVYPTAAEEALDIALSDGAPADQRILHQSTARGALKGALGDTNLFPWPANRSKASLERRSSWCCFTTRLALGAPGRLCPALLGARQRVGALEDP